MSLHVKDAVVGPREQAFLFSCPWGRSLVPLEAQLLTPQGCSCKLLP